MTRAEIFTPSVRSDPDDADFVKTEGFSSIKKETRTLRKRMHRFGGHDDADGWRTADLGGGRSDCSRGCVRWQPACRRRRRRRRPLAIFAPPSGHRRVVHRRRRSLLARIHGRRDAGTPWRRMGESRNFATLDHFGSGCTRADILPLLIDHKVGDKWVFFDGLAYESPTHSHN